MLARPPKSTVFAALMLVATVLVAAIVFNRPAVVIVRGFKLEIGSTQVSAPQ